jgi:hypothetical protein
MYDGALILIGPLLALVAICRTGRWQWRVLDASRGPGFLIGLLNVLFWVGFFGAITAGVLRLFGVFP